MDNETIAAVLRDVYNGWWLRWRRRVIGRHDPVWEVIKQEACELLDKYDHAPLVVYMVRNLMDELEERSRNAEKSR